LDIEEFGLRWYDKMYTFCNYIGLTRLVRKPQLQQACNHTIICNMAEGCGRRSCPARVLAIDTYVRRIKEAR
jgi:hypothetical protein